MLSMIGGTVLAEQTSILDVIKDANKNSNQGDQVLTKVDKFIQFFIYKLLPLAGVLMMGVSGFYLMTGAEEGKKKVASAVFGVGIIALSPTLVSWLMGMFR